MNQILLILSLAVGCQEQPQKNDVSEQPNVSKKDTPPKDTPVVNDAPAAKETSPTVQNIVSSIIEKDTLDINITTLNVKKDTKKVHIAGDAIDNATVAVLLKALEKNTNLQNVYLEKSEEQSKDNPRKVFSITANTSQ